MLPKGGCEVVIAGVGGKFPETNNISELQEKLFEKANLVTEDNRRWPPGVFKTPKATGKVLEEYKFDAAFFGVHRKLCVTSEPMMKLTIERCYEAMVDAGVNPFTLRGRNIAVIMGTINSESEILMLTHTGLINDGFGILGHSQSMIANRVSYFFNFVGPSFTINSSWTGGLSAIEQAAGLIRKGACTAALVTSAYIMWAPSVSNEYVALNMLTFENKGRVFDENAQGFIRSDGIVTYFLQRKEEANRIYATIVNVHTQALGHRECGFLRYDIGLERFLTNFYQKADCDPTQIAYMEPEGMAIKDIDAVELNSIANSMCEKRKAPLLIGSVKGNVGQAHVAGCFMAIAKSIIAMETGQIPATLYYDSPNRNVPGLHNGTITPVTEHTSLPGNLVAVNNLSISGTAGHLVMRRHEKQKGLPADQLHRLMLVSARHEEGAKLIVEKLRSMPLDVEFVSLVNNIHKTTIPNHLWRGYVISPSDVNTKSEILYCDSEKQRPIWFVFSGMGSQWNGMGRDLLQIPIFAAAIDKCDKVLRPRQVDIKHILTTDDPKVLDNILNSFIGIAAVQVGLVDILRAVGVKPDGIIGHSAGELACAYADGSFTAEQMVLAAHARGIASLSGNLRKGLMAAVGLAYNEMKDKVPSSIDIACHNAAESCTISGPWEDMVKFIDELKAKGVFVKAVSTGEIAFHSRYVKPIAAHLNKLLEKVIPNPKARSSKWISTSSPEDKWNTKDAQYASSVYYTNNLLNPVLFEEGAAFIPPNAIVVEISPHGLMQAILRRSLRSDCINIPLTNRTVESSTKYLLSALGKLYMNKVDIDINALFPPVEYPVSRGTPSLAPLVTWDHTDTWFTEISKVLKMLTEEKSELTAVVDENCNEFDLWSEHRIENEIVVPLAQLLNYPWKLIMETNRLHLQEQAIVIEDAVVNGRILVKPTMQKVDVSLFRGSNKFQVYLEIADEKFEPQLTGTLSVIKRPHLPLEPLDTNGHTLVRVSRTEFYSTLSQHGHQLGPKFQAVQSLCIKGKDCEGTVCWTGDMLTFLDALFKVVVYLNSENKQKIVEINSFRRLLVDSPYFFELSKGTEIQIRYDSKANVLHCNGLKLEGPTVSSQDVKQAIASSLTWKSVKFVPYSENVAKIDEFVSLTVQLVAEEGLNSWSNKVANFTTFEIRENLDKLIFITEQYHATLKSLPNVVSRFHVKEAHKAKDELKQDSTRTSLVIGEYRTLLPFANSFQNRGNIFYLTLLPHTVELEEKTLQVILSHQLQHGSLVLLKRWTDPTKLRVFELDWMAGLRQFMSHNTNGQTVVVVSRHWQPRQALKTLALETYAHQLRCVFLDKQAPQFSLTSPLFQKQLTLGLSVNVLTGRAWGSYRTVDLPDILPVRESLTKLESSLKSLQLSCVGLNTRTFTLQPEVPANQLEMKYVDYCGTRRTGERVMGLARFDSASQKVVPDQMLSWRIPSQWSMEDAVTVPFTYSLAYYSLQVRAQLQKDENVLVHAGMTPIGQAAIAVSLELGGNVYVTVSTNTQVAALLAAFPQIIPTRVIVLDQCNFEVEINKLNKTKKVNVILNCLKGKDTNASLRLIDKFSRIIHLGDINVEYRETISMFPFIYFTQMYGVSLDNIVNADEETKRRLRTLIDSGIKHGVVKPLRHRIFSIAHIGEALKHLKESNTTEKTIVAKPEGRFKGSIGFQCDPGESFIILGTKQGLWLDLAEWLLKNGARKLIIASLKQNLTTNVSRKFNYFMGQHRATIVMTTLNRLECYKDAEEFLQEAIKMGPVAGIFCTYMEEKSPQVTHLDSASRALVPQLKHFVCLLGGSASVCESRTQLGLSSCLVQSESSLLKPHHILPYLGSVLTDESSLGHTFLISDQAWTAKQRSLTISLKDVKTYLPHSLEQLSALGQATPDQIGFHELTSRSLPYRFMRYQLIPVFLIPGFDSGNLRSLARHLMHPTFCPSMPPCLLSVQESAQQLLKNTLEIQQKGLYNLVGDSWSGALALELATLLEGLGHQVELFLLDAVPTTTQQWAKVFCHPIEGFSDIKFLTVLLDLSEIIIKHLETLPTWEEQLQFSLQSVMVPFPEDKTSSESVAVTLTALRNHIMALLAFQPSEQLFSGNVHLLKSRSASDSDPCDLKKYCKKTPTVHIMEDETFIEMLENPQTAATINKNLIFTWDL